MVPAKIAEIEKSSRKNIDSNSNKNGKKVKK